MEITTLNQPLLVSSDKQLSERYFQLNTLLEELGTKALPDDVILLLNQRIKSLNESVLEGKALSKSFSKQQREIIQLIEKKLKIVPKNYYRNLWMAIGMAAFGIPLGAAISNMSHNVGLMAIGIPIGLGIGIAVGTSMDQKAAARGKQLHFEAKY